MNKPTMSKAATYFQSDTYDSHVRSVIPFYEMLIDEVLDVVGTLKAAPEVWLDTGCGTGYLRNRQELPAVLPQG